MSLTQDEMRVYIEELEENIKDLEKELIEKKFQYCPHCNRMVKLKELEMGAKDGN